MGDNQALNYIFAYYSSITMVVLSSKYSSAHFVVRQNFFTREIPFREYNFPIRISSEARSNAFLTR